MGGGEDRLGDRRHIGDGPKALRRQGGRRVVEHEGRAAEGGEQACDRRVLPGGEGRGREVGQELRMGRLEGRE